MDTQKYRTYTKEFKLEALSLLESSGESASGLERELGITAGVAAQVEAAIQSGQGNPQS